MSAPVPYLHFAGDAATALRHYRSVFGGDLELHTFADFARDDGPGDAVAHGGLTGPVTLFAADVAPGEPSLRIAGLMLSLLGHASPSELERWFTALAAGGEIVDPLQRRPWGDHDGVVRDRFGVTWLVGYEASSVDDPAAPDDPATS